MVRVFKKILRWISRILLGIAALLLLLLLLFYLFRGKITDRAVAYINERQPGEVVIAKINLKPFLDFPNVSLRLQDVHYLTAPGSNGELDTLPVLTFNDIFVSMDVVQLVRGTYMISEVRLANGTINYRVGADSVSNVEKALGIVFGSEEVADTVAGDVTPVKFDLQLLEVTDLLISYEDQPANTSFSVYVNGLESGFSYYPDQVTASVMLQSELQMARVRDLSLDKPRSLSFNSSLYYDQQLRRVALDQSTLDLRDATFAIGGEVDLDARTVDLDFSAVNSGIDLLNFLLSGVLNLDAIEQIGEGSIRLEGNASGSYSKQVPLMKVNVMARDMAFYVRSIDQSVTGIAFNGYLTNGPDKDLSGAEVHLNDFHVDFPKGSLDANIEVHNLQQPYADIALSGDADLSVISEIISQDAVEGLEGNLNFEGSIVGSIDQQTGNFLDSAGLLRINMSDVGFFVAGHHVSQMRGEWLVREELIGLRDMEVVIDSNRIKWGGTVSNLLPWLLDFDVDPSADLAFSSESLYPGKFLNDTLLPGPVRDLRFRLSFGSDGQLLRNALAEKYLPPVELVLDDLSMILPGYAPISDGGLMLYLDADTAGVRDLHAKIGESAFGLDAALVHYDRLVKKDSAAHLVFSFDLSANRLLARDLLTIHDEFSVLPPRFAVEEILDLKCKGKLKARVYDILKDSILPDFRFVSDEMYWRLREYPDAFNDLVLDVEQRDSLLIIHHFTGSIGESNLDITASVANLLDSARTIIGQVGIRSELIDLDRLLAYALLEEPGTAAAEEMGNFTAKNATNTISEAPGRRGKRAPGKDGTVDDPAVQEVLAEKAVPVSEVSADTSVAAPPDLSRIEFPDLVLEVDVRELRYEGNVLKQLDGRLSTKPYKILYFDQFSVQSESGGSMKIDGQFNVSDPSLYMLSANFEIDTLNMGDFNLQIAIGDSLYSLEDNFNGILSADGIAEFFINPDFSINTDFSTAMFNVRLENGRVKHFTPLRALAKYTGNKDLDNVKFGLLRNSFTLLNGAVQIPLMSIESTIGQILLEGEQYLDGDFLYLARLPVSLVRGTAWNMLTNQQNRKTEEGEVQQMRSQKFLVLTVSGKDGTEEVKMGDRRDQFR